MGIQFFLVAIVLIQQSSITHELPLNIPYAAKAQFIKEQFSEWQSFIHGCFDITASVRRSGPRNRNRNRRGLDRTSGFGHVGLMEITVVGLWISGILKQPV